MVAGVSLAGYLGLRAFEENLLYFFSPSDVVAGKAPKGKSFELGGLVSVGSVKREALKVSFQITDNLHTFQVEYQGILPDLFREGQGVIATGALENGVFIASRILAKHDENYMSPKVAAALKQKHETTSKSK